MSTHRDRIPSNAIANRVIDDANLSEDEEDALAHRFAKQYQLITNDDRLEKVAADLVRQLLEARDTRELTRLQQRLLRVDVLIVDELGFVPFDRVGGELLFNLLTDRYERRATVVTTNLAFADWVTVFAGDDKLTTALLDRLAHHATVLTTKGKSYRMRKRRPREDPS